MGGTGRQTQKTGSPARPAQSSLNTRCARSQSEVYITPRTDACPPHAIPWYIGTLTQRTTSASRQAGRRQSGTGWLLLTSTETPSGWCVFVLFISVVCCIIGVDPCGSRKRKGDILEESAEVRCMHIWTCCACRRVYKSRRTHARTQCCG